MTSSLAMQHAGFSETQICDRNLQRRVLRKKNSSPEGVAVTTPTTEHVEARKQEISPITLASTASTASAVSTFSGGSSSSTSLREKLPKSMRLTSKQAHAVRKETAIEKADTADKHKTAMKEATIMHQNDQDAAKEAPARGDGIHMKMTGRHIAELVNAKCDTNIQDRTIRKQVSEREAGLSPERGPKGTIGSRHHKALCGAFESHVKLKQVTRDSNLKRTFLQKLVNAVANVCLAGFAHILPQKVQTGT